MGVEGGGCGNEARLMPTPLATQTWYHISPANSEQCVVLSVSAVHPGGARMVVHFVNGAGVCCKVTGEGTCYCSVQMLVTTCLAMFERVRRRSAPLVEE